MRRQQGDDFPEFGADLPDGSQYGLGAFCRIDGARGGFRNRCLDRLRLRTAVCALQRLARSGDGVALPVHQPLDFQRQFHFAAPVKALSGPALVGLELRELGFPETKDVRLDAAQARYIADLEVEAIGDHGRVDGARSGWVRGHGSPCEERPSLARTLLSAQYRDRQPRGEAKNAALIRIDSIHAMVCGEYVRPVTRLPPLSPAPPRGVPSPSAARSAAARRADTASASLPIQTMPKRRELPSTGRAAFRGPEAQCRLRPGQ